jgi:hypothetical protein
MLRSLGAKVYVCPAHVSADDERSYYNVAKRLHEETKGSVYINQYFNQLNIDAHYKSTGPEIWEQTNGQITHLIACSGTGGTISGAAKFLKEIGTIRIDALLDYGSYRDLQRNRNGVNRSPLLTTKYGFEQWYLNALPEETRKRAESLISEQVSAIEALSASEFEKQYCVALGFRVPWRYTCGLSAAIYLAELRSGKTVHPTARNIALKLTESLKNAFPDLVLHSDTDKDDWDIKRGTQDIVKK